MNIRIATSQDSLLLSSLCQDVQRLHAKHHPDIFKIPATEDFAVAFFDEMLADKNVAVFIAEENGQAVGYILCKLIERPESPFTLPVRYVLIDQISVRPLEQGGGIGTALMKSAESHAKELGVDKIQLDSWDFNTKAHVFFEDMGFDKFNFRFWHKI
ncbi:MAG: GNAT family N-acetyltransferase [Anaerolineales bacterium]|nr:GNAT family N-acetyltransferase [Anaerolineales bacterium]